MAVPTTTVASAISSTSTASTPCAALLITSIRIIGCVNFLDALSASVIGLSFGQEFLIHRIPVSSKGKVVCHGHRDTAEF